MYLIISGTLRLSIEAVSGRSRPSDSVIFAGLPATFNGQPYSLSCEVVDGRLRDVRYIFQKANEFRAAITDREIEIRIDRSDDRLHGGGEYSIPSSNRFLPCLVA